jgi:hypothetical protein
VARAPGATIALTEATRGYNESTLAVAEAAGLTHVQVEDGDEHDAPCIEADGSVWSIDHAREHTLEHPRCRRAFTPIPAVALAAWHPWTKAGRKRRRRGAGKRPSRKQAAHAHAARPERRQARPCASSRLQAQQDRKKKRR